jgi:ribosomal protein S16
VYVYRDFRKDAGCYTVGYYDPKGKWEPESDYETKEQAADRVHWLNGGANTEVNHA